MAPDWSDVMEKPNRVCRPQRISESSKVSLRSRFSTITHLHNPSPNIHTVLFVFLLCVCVCGKCFPMCFSGVFMCFSTSIKPCNVAVFQRKNKTFSFFFFLPIWCRFSTVWISLWRSCKASMNSGSTGGSAMWFWWLRTRESLLTEPCWLSPVHTSMPCSHWAWRRNVRRRYT